MFLTRNQVAELTGARTRAKQVEVLRRNGLPFIVNAAGWPVVTIAAVEGRRGPEAAAPQGWAPRILAA